MDRPTRRSTLPSAPATGVEVRRRRGGPRRTSAEKRQRILAAALRCFVSVGYEHTRIGDICAESGFSVGSVYHFFGSKAEVAADLCADGTRRWAETVANAVLTATSAEAAVRGYILAYFEWVGENSDLYNFMNDHRPEATASVTMPDIEAAHASVDAAVRTRFDAEAAAGRMRRMPIHVYRAILDGPSYAYLLWWSRHRVDMAGLPLALADATWQALAPASSTERKDASAALVQRAVVDGEKALAAGRDFRLPAGGPPGGAMRRRILTAALTVFGELGYEQATVGDIAQHSGASIGTIYYHFASKEEIAAHWCREGWRDWTHTQLAAMNADDDAPSIVRNVVLAKFAWVQANADLYAFLYDARRIATGPLAVEAYETTRCLFMTSLNEAMAAAAERGEVRALSASAYTAVIIGMCQGYLVPWTARREPLADIPEIIASAVWRALRVDQNGDQRSAPGSGIDAAGGGGQRAPSRLAHTLLTA